MKTSSLNQISRFFLRLALVASILLIFDKGTGFLLKHYYFSQEYGKESQTTYIIDSTVADILVFGSSRASHHYVPEVFERRLHETFFNTGKDGNYILSSYAILKSVVKRYNPKLIILDIRAYDLGHIPSEYERLSQLLPYYQQYPEIREVIDLRGPFEKLKQISSIYSYNSLIFQIINGNLGLIKAGETNLKGYVPLSGTMTKEKIDIWDLNNTRIDENKIHALKDIISTCKQKNIDLVFVQSPSWLIIQDSVCKKIISDMCSENGIAYIDMSNDSTFIKRPDYFADMNHLNNTGAIVFSDMLVNKLHNTH